MTPTVDDLNRITKSLRAQLDYAHRELEFYRGQYGEFHTVLSLIAAPKRADGTYNRCREACENLAKQALTDSESHWRKTFKPKGMAE
jgi:hypothetical protein